jgi:nucleoside-diphosphate-sugar epimerase
MIAVTGANGLLGNYIVRKLHREKIPFIAMKRAGSDISFLQDIAHEIEWREADVLDPIALREAFQGVTGVFHTAAYVSFNPRKAKAVFEINTTGTKHVVNACLSAGVKRLLHVSSVAALGRQKGQTFLDENNKWSDHALNSNYAKSKYEAELEVFRGQEEGLSTVMVNPSVILGYSNWNKSSAQLFKYLWNEKPFYIDGSLNYVDVRDLAEVSFQLFQSSIEGERFIVSAGSTTFQNFFNMVAKTFGKRSPWIKVNPAVANTLAFLESGRTYLTGSEPLITRETARLTNAHFEYDNQKVKKALNFSFQSIEDTIQWCCQQYAQAYGIKNQ